MNESFISLAHVIEREEQLCVIAMGALGDLCDDLLRINHEDHIAYHMQYVLDDALIHMNRRNHNTVRINIERLLDYLRTHRMAYDAETVTYFFYEFGKILEILSGIIHMVQIFIA